MPCYGRDLVVPDISLHGLIWKNLLKYGDDIAMIDSSRDGMSLTYMDLYRNSRKVAAYLQSIGIKKGDFVCICTRLSLEYYSLLIGILGSGAVAVPCNPSYRKTEILHECNISCPRVVFVEEEIIERMKSVKDDVSFIEKLIVIGDSNEFPTLSTIMSDPNIEPLREVEIDPRNDCSISPRSSGTTGLPKCLLLTHRGQVALYSTDFGASGILKTRDTSQSMYTDRPLYHASGFWFVLRNIIHGVRTVTAKTSQLDNMFRVLEKYKVTLAMILPSQIVDMVNANHSNKYDLSSFKMIETGGAALPPNVAQRVMTQYDVSMVLMYGANEIGLVSSYFIPKGDKSNSTGRPLEGVGVKIVNIVTEEECLTGCDGEIRIKTEQIMKGYYKNDTANATAFDQDGWLKTGDIGKLDENGNVYITGRLKEIIQYRGTQIAPTQLESVIISHPKVADVGVIGIPDERDGEIPKAFVVPSDKSLTVEDVHKIVNDNLVEYKHLRGGVEFVTSIPKSAIGKIQRRELKKMAGF